MKTWKHMSSRNILSLALAAGLALGVASARAQQFVYPAKGQSPEKQKKDEYECHAWAVGQTGFDPSKPPAPAPPQAQPQQPAGPSGARLRGATAGAAVGAITDKDKSDAALAGAVGAASAQRGQKRQAAKQQQAAGQQQQQQATAQQQQGLAGYQDARGVCLQGRGYTVK